MPVCDHSQEHTKRIYNENQPIYKRKRTIKKKYVFQLSPNKSKSFDAHSTEKRTKGNLWNMGQLHGRGLQRELSRARKSN